MIESNVNEIIQKIEAAASKVGRDPKDVTLIGVSKTYPVEDILQAEEAGITCFGENKVQELTKKMEQIESDIKWHFIGHLQTNKVKYIAGKVELIHSVESIKLAKEINKQGMKVGQRIPILIEVNVAKEESKYGVAPEELIAFIREISDLENVEIKGLMTVAPFVDTPEDNREIFRKMYQLSVDIQKQNIDNISMNILSMGMSNDFEIAIEEGATHVRIGTSIFGKREYNKA